MKRVAIAGWAAEIGGPDGRNDAELLAPVVARALVASGVERDQIGVVCTASSEFLNGVVGSMMGAFDAFTGWPPRTHSHLDGDGAFALYEAWIRLLAGEADAALVCAYGRPLADDPAAVLTLQLDPYVLGPLGVGSRHLAALQARALIDAGRCTEADLAVIACARRRGLEPDDVLSQPYVAAPLRATDCSNETSGAAAVVLVTEELADRASEPPAWIAGIDQRMDTAAVGARDLTHSPSTRAAATRLGLTGARLDVVELHAPYTHQELILLDAVGAAEIGRVNPSGGVLAADALMVSGLIRIGEAAAAIHRGEARRAVAHATNGPCLQHNLLCDLKSEER